jgi:hypothetical protein
MEGEGNIMNLKGEKIEHITQVTRLCCPFGMV